MEVGRVVNGYAIHPGADLMFANLERADLTDADLTDADLRGANLVVAKLTGTIWRMTTGPDGAITDTGEEI